MKTDLVTTLKRKATQINGNFQSERMPALSNQPGRPAACLVDVESSESTERRLSVPEGIAVGEQAAREGRTTSHGDAKKRLARWLE